VLFAPQQTTSRVLEIMERGRTTQSRIAGEPRGVPETHHKLRDTALQTIKQTRDQPPPDRPVVKDAEIPQRVKKASTMPSQDRKHLQDMFDLLTIVESAQTEGHVKLMRRKSTSTVAILGTSEIVLDAAKAKT